MGGDGLNTEAVSIRRRAPCPILMIVRETSQSTANKQQICSGPVAWIDDPDPVMQEIFR
ncbi:hypothetical protein NXC14_CH04367 [Rhizobium sp. NXC14]|nr:hypothetical protein NXC14_CH04367 [Rhizobium sp. NXC14]